VDAETDKRKDTQFGVEQFVLFGRLPFLLGEKRVEISNKGRVNPQKGLVEMNVKLAQFLLNKAG
jgi:hypothetical protein